MHLSPKEGKIESKNCKRKYNKNIERERKFLLCNKPQNPKTDFIQKNGFASEIFNGHNIRSIFNGIPFIWSG